ncbi:MAG: 4-cresol dehydrogenase (hydroxylating) [Phenylobacterium sp.]|jgi:4-cresol dehydrogenase (hydroxylating)
MQEKSPQQTSNDHRNQQQDNPLNSISQYFRCLNASDALARYGLDTGAFTRRIAGAFVAQNIKAVELILQRANQQGFKIWPISGGMNFGYGTSMPVEEDNYILDLSELKNIVYNPESQSVTIEPGVNQQDLADFLDCHKLPYLVPTTGLGPNGSLIGNALDAGYGLTPVCDHFEALSDIEGVFGNGIAFSSHFRDIGCYAMAQSWSAGTGPSINSLLRQGNYAVIARATIRLARQPEASRILIIQWPSENAFIHYQSEISTIMEDIPGIGGIISVNAHRGLSTFPDAPLANPLTGQARLDYLNTLAKQRKIAPWTSLGTLYGSKQAVKGAVKDIRRRLPEARVLAFTVSTIKKISSMVKWLPKSMLGDIHRQISTLEETIGFAEGRPTSSFLQMAYALDDKGHQMTRQSNPAKDGQGILWYAPLVPMNKKYVKNYLKAMRDTLYQHGFDNLLALTARSSRVHCGTIPLLFKRDNPQAALRAKTCYRALVKLGISMGMPPYRIGAEYMTEIYPAKNTGFARSLHDIKTQLDPNEVIAPGRYLAPFE